MCKGIYVEPPSIAFQDREEIRDSYTALVEDLLERGLLRRASRRTIRVLVDRPLATIARLRLSSPAYEFQMLLGVARRSAPPARRRGHRLRVYVPYGQVLVRLLDAAPQGKPRRSPATS